MRADVQLLACCLVFAIVWLQAVSTAKPVQGGEKDWLAELRRTPKPSYDSSGKYKTFSKHFVRQAGESFTRLSYNCTFSDDQYVNLDDELFGVANVSCADNKIYISTDAPEGMEELVHALAHSPTGLLYGGKTWACRGIHGQEPGPIYR